MFSITDMYVIPQLIKCIIQIQKGNKIMPTQPNQPKQQSQYSHPQSPPQNQTYSSSKISSLKRVGQIITRHRSPTQTGNHLQNNEPSDPSSSTRQLPTPKGVLSQMNKYRIKNRVKTNNDHYRGSLHVADLGKANVTRYAGNQSRLRTYGDQGRVDDGRYERRHGRTKSFQEQRQSLQKELQMLMKKKNKLDQLRQNKKKLKQKLTTLQQQLRQIKSSQIPHLHPHPPIKPRPPKFHRLKPLNIPRTLTTEQHKQQLSKLIEVSTEQYMLRQIKNAQHMDSDDNQDENEVTNYYYEGHLNHKCLNCTHFHTKIQDVRIPVQIKNDFNL